jgi:hypothetical protein
VSPRDSLIASVGAQRLFVGGNKQLNYIQYDGSLAYERQFDERLTVGGRVIAEYADYSAGRSVSSFGPQATVRLRLSSDWDLSAAAGVVRTEQNLGSLGGKDSSYDLALDGSLCRNLEVQRICARIARRTQSSIIGGASTSTSAGIDYFAHLGPKDSIQARASIVRSGGFRILGVNQKSTFYTLAGSYTRKLNERLTAGTDLSVRKLSTFGGDPKMDVGGSAFVRYRLGDLR